MFILASGITYAVFGPTRFDIACQNLKMLFRRFVSIDITDQQGSTAWEWIFLNVQENRGTKFYQSLTVLDCLLHLEMSERIPRTQFWRNGHPFQCESGCFNMQPHPFDETPFRSGIAFDWYALESQNASSVSIEKVTKCL